MGRMWLYNGTGWTGLQHMPVFVLTRSVCTSGLGRVVQAALQVCCVARQAAAWQHAAPWHLCWCAVASLLF